MTNLGTLRRITASELGGVIARACEEHWKELLLVGPDVALDADSARWARLSNRTVFELTEVVGGLEEQLVQVRTLEHLVLVGLRVGDRGAKVLATNLKQLATLELRRNGIGDPGAQAVATNLERLTSLHLGSNQIGDPGAQAIATNLKKLASLHLGSNQIGDPGAEAIATGLKQLISLNLNYNQIGNRGAQTIGRNLKRLTSLDLWGNQIGDAGALAIATNLKDLTSLYLWGNQIGDAGASAIATNLRQLAALHLGSNQIGDVGALAIATNLEHLTSLNLNYNQIGDAGALAIAANLEQLTSLELRVNQVGDAGAQAIAANLEQLAVLDLNGNQIGDLGAHAIATNLKQLTSLNLGRNQIGNEGTQAISTGLPELERLVLSDNAAIRSIRALSGLTAIKYLSLSNTGVSDLSPLRPLIERGVRVTWEQYGGSGILVYGCPLLHPTPEIISHGHEAVLNYFLEMDRQGIDYLYEAKVLLVGEGGAGKTSALRRLYYPELPLPSEDESTRGIEVYRQEFSRADNGKFRLNLWDFGGQQIYHATHQFFLTKNSLYVLVDDTRKDHKSVRDEGFKYWFEVVEVFGAKSPVLIFQNEKGGRSKKIDEAGIKGRFPNVKDVLRGDLGVAGAADGLRRAIEHFVQALPHVGEAVPAKWVSVRSAIEEVAKEKPHISQDDYFALYAQFLEPDREKALFLSRYLHDLGVFLHFQDDPRLCKTVIVQNRWATEAVFRILDDESVKQRPGRFTLDDCQRVWASPRYADMHNELLALMEKFELCYRLPDTQPDTWLVPQLLHPSTPTYVSDWPTPADLALTYRYEFLPRGLISRLMVRMHRFVTRPDLSWSNGALFEREQTQLLALTSDRGEEIVLRARGPESQALLTVIGNALDELNETFHGLEGKVNKWVPCICSKCRTSTTPELFEEKRLKQRKRDGKLTLECPASYGDVSVLELLEGLRMDKQPNWGLKTIRVFLASSEELRADRDAFDLYFRQQNDHFIKRGLYLEVIRWENFLDAMSERPLQDDYNEAVREADIFVSLFASKTGKFTEEEFDTAHAAFKSAGKPYIFTFFRDVQVPATVEGHAALTTLVNFQKKLGNLGHFWTKYQSTEHLQLQFRDQLDKLDVKRRT